LKIYTRTGDDGTTGLFGGGRVPKDDPRVEAYGTVDEANAALGLARAAGPPPALDAVLAHAQATLFEVGAALASPGRAGSAPVEEGDVAALERAIDDLEATLPPLRSFVLPAGSEAAARLHVARTVVRRAERLAVGLRAHGPVPEGIVRYLNRLSDWCFVAARAANRAARVPDVAWTPRTASRAR
jgi:cob(I)alamin adenosyltransferase